MDDETTPAEGAAPVTVFVEVLTDEELSVVARPGPMPVLPHLDGLAEEEREHARRAAYRSLLARGIIDPPTPQAIATATGLRDGSVDLMVRRDIASVVALRAAPRAVVAAARTTAFGQDFWYAHVVDDVVLLEEVSGDGLHRFALAGAEHLDGLVVGAVLHPDAGDADGPRLPLTGDEGDPSPPDEVLVRLGAAFLRADVVVRRPGDTEPRVLTLFSGPDGSWIVEPLPGAAPGADPVSAEAARERVVEAVAGVIAEAVVPDGR